LSIAILLSVLFGALLHASWNALIKWEPDKLVAAGAIATGAGVVALPIALFGPLPLGPAWPLIVFSAVVHVGYFVLVGYALRHADLGVAYPLTRGSAPAFTAIIAAIWLGESLALSGWLAVGAIATGVVTLSADAMLRGGLTLRAAALAFGNAAVVVLYTLVDGVGARLAGDAVAYVTWMMAATAAIIVVLTLLFRRDTIAGHGAGFWLRAFIGGGLALASYGIAIWAMTKAPIGLVAALRETSILFGTALSALVLKERFGWTRHVAAAVVVSGAVILKLV